MAGDPRGERPFVTARDNQRGIGQPLRFEPPIQVDVRFAMRFKHGDVLHLLTKDHLIEAGFGERRISHVPKQTGEGCESFCLAGLLADPLTRISGPQKCPKIVQRMGTGEFRSQPLPGGDEPPPSATGRPSVQGMQWHR